MKSRSGSGVGERAAEPAFDLGAAAALVAIAESSEPGSHAGFAIPMRSRSALCGSTQFRDRLVIGVTGDPLFAAYYVILTSLVSLIANVPDAGDVHALRAGCARRTKRPRIGRTAAFPRCEAPRDHLRCS